MSDNTKVADLPELPKPDWRAKDGVSEGVYSATQMREFGMACYQAALARQSPSYEALDIIARSVCAALERAGVTECDDPGESIDVLVQDYERTITRLSDALNAENGPTFMGEPVLARQDASVSAGDAVFAFASLLTTLPHVVPFGSAAWATPAADLASAFNSANGLHVSVNFPDGLKFPKIEGDLLARVEQAAAPPSAPVGQEPFGHIYRVVGGANHPSAKREWNAGYSVFSLGPAPADGVKGSIQYLNLYTAPPAAQAYTIKTESGELPCSLAVSVEWEKSEEYIARLEAAQAVDLGAVREEVRCWRTGMLSAQESMCGIAAIIDQKAGKAGGGA